MDMESRGTILWADDEIDFLKSHILVNTSYFEGSNNSIVEAINNNLLILELFGLNE